MPRHEFRSKDTVSVTYVPNFDDASTKHRSPGFTVYANPEELGKWRQDHGSVPMSDVLERMQVYVVRGGTQSGIHEAPSKQILSDAFQTDDMDNIMETILESGEVQHM